MPDVSTRLATIPLFAGVTPEHLAELCAAFRRRDVPEGEVLFRAGEVPERFHLLVEGEIGLGEGGAERIRLRAPAPVGELAALAGLPRSFTAVAGPGCIVLELGVVALMHFFETRGDIGFPVHHNLLKHAADKLRRDLRRIDEMRHNIVVTQKAMKRMREALLDSDDTPLHASLYEELDTLIEQNRKGHYLVEPTRAMPAQVRLEPGVSVDVLALSNEWLHLAPHGAPPRPAAEWSGVLVIGGDEIVVSGKVDRVADDRIVIDLDPLIDELTERLEGHLTRLQMLDIVV